MIAVYASQPPSPATTQHSLGGGSLQPYPRRTFIGWKAPASLGALQPLCLLSGEFFHRVSPQDLWTMRTATVQIDAACPPTKQRRARSFSALASTGAERIRNKKSRPGAAPGTACKGYVGFSALVSVRRAAKGREPKASSDKTDNLPFRDCRFREEPELPAPCGPCSACAAPDVDLDRRGAHKAKCCLSPMMWKFGEDRSARRRARGMEPNV